jgi:hypothetical protein
MTMFARRSIQSFLNALDSILTPAQFDSLVDRLNLDDRDSVAAEWEVCVLFALMHLGRVTYEPPLPGTSNPDILFTSNHDARRQFIADVTLISDIDLEEKNPINELTQLVAAQARKLGISGVFSFNAGSTAAGKYGSYKVQLSIPHKRHLRVFVRDRIVPHLRSIAKSPAEPREFSITEPGYNLTVSYIPGQRFSFSNYRSYRNATKKDSNPLFNSLKRKREQLRDAQYEGCKGIIVCDGGCELLTKSFTIWDSYSKEQVVKEFFRQSTSISFVILLWVEQMPDSRSTPRPHRVIGQIAINPKARNPLATDLEELLRQLPEQWPQPIQTGERTRLELEGYGPRDKPRYWGRRFGGYQMSAGSNSFTYRMSARELIEILSGRRSHRDFEQDAGFAAASAGRINPFENALQRGLTISAVNVEQFSDQDDDWIEFRMTGPDPALSPFQVPSSKPK